MAHSYVISFTDDSDLGAQRMLSGVDILDLANKYRKDLNVIRSMITIIVDENQLFRTSCFLILC